MKLFVTRRIRVLRIYIVFLSIILPIELFAQHPFSPKTDIVYTLPPIPLDSLQILQSQNPNLFAFPFFLHTNIITEGSSIILDDTIYYTMQFASPGAFSLNVIFDSVYIHNNGKFFLYNPSKTLVEGPFTKQDIYKHTFASPLIWDDTICITYSEPFTFSQKSSLFITQIAHDFLQSFESKQQLKAIADTCNININCTEGQTWQNEKRAVCRLIIGGTSVCSGTLLNNTSNDLTPYVLTANHCLSSQIVAEKTVFYFNYEYDNCEGSGLIYKNDYVSGSNLLATGPSGKLDFTLLQMYEIPPTAFNVYYAGWDATDNSLKGSVCIHHPRGDAKKISIDYDYYTTASFFSYLKLSHWKISRWDKGTTESGSSGSGLFNMNKQIIGNLSGGEANCEKPINDYFSKFSLAWDYYSNTNEQLKIWLDPQNTGKTTCNGFDPNFDYSPIISNITKTDTIALFDFNNKATGIWTGTNEIGWKQYADYVSYTTHNKIYAFSLVGKIDTIQDLSNIQIKIWQGISAPEQVLFSTPLQKSMIMDSIWISIIPDEPIETHGSFWIGYEIANNSTAFMAYMAKPRISDNSLYIKHPKSWIPTQSIGANSSLAIQTFVSNQPDTISSIIIGKPLFASQIDTNVLHFETRELFAHDSIPCLFDSTLYFILSSDKGISTWNGPNELEMTCVSNMFSKNEANYIRGLKLGIHSIPDSQNNTTLKIWNKTYTEVLAEKVISNNDADALYYNEIHFDSPVPVGDTFAAGICFDKQDYEKNVSIFSLHNSYTNITSNVYIPNSWFSLQDYSYEAQYAIQPITALSQYHFNPDSARINKYPIVLHDTVFITPNVSLTVFPNPCNNYISIQFNKTLVHSIDVSIYNSFGYKITNQTRTQENGLFTISTETIPKGIYIIEIEVQNKKIRQKFIRE